MLWLPALRSRPQSPMTGLADAGAADAGAAGADAAGAARAGVTGTDFSSTGFAAQAPSRASAAIHDSSLIASRPSKARAIRASYGSAAPAGRLAAGNLPHPLPPYRPCRRRPL